MARPTTPEERARLRAYGTYAHLTEQQINKRFAFVAVHRYKDPYDSDPEAFNTIRCYGATAESADTQLSHRIRELQEWG